MADLSGSADLDYRSASRWLIDCRIRCWLRRLDCSGCLGSAASGSGLGRSRFEIDTEADECHREQDGNGQQTKKHVPVLGTARRRRAVVG